MTNGGSPYPVEIKTIEFKSQVNMYGKEFFYHRIGDKSERFSTPFYTVYDLMMNDLEKRTLENRIEKL